ncbi:hypothetical protein F5Y15DRAFT_156842 [Xylariaceae sp. FL0016]|nr:hypothetical protein F5Y15DRAFT_156842 [Xylariaceae sp. FL0016]
MPITRSDFHRALASRLRQTIHTIAYVFDNHYREISLLLTFVSCLSATHKIQSLMSSLGHVGSSADKGPERSSAKSDENMEEQNSNLQAAVSDSSSQPYATTQFRAVSNSGGLLPRLRPKGHTPEARNQCFISTQQFLEDPGGVHSSRQEQVPRPITSQFVDPHSIASPAKNGSQSSNMGVRAARSDQALGYKHSSLSTTNGLRSLQMGQDHPRSPGSKSSGDRTLSKNKRRKHDYDSPSIQEHQQRQSQVRQEGDSNRNRLYEPAKSPRTLIACNKCNKKKKRCDKLRPKCTYCRKRDLDYVYRDTRHYPPDSPHRSKPRKREKRKRQTSSREEGVD